MELKSLQSEHQRMIQDFELDKKKLKLDLSILEKTIQENTTLKLQLDSLSKAKLHHDADMQQYRMTL